MKKFCFFLCVFLLTSTSLLFAERRGKHELVPAGHWVYDALTAISLEQGHSNLSEQAPLSIAEIRMYLDEVEFSSLSDAGLLQYNRILDYFNEENLAFKADVISIGVAPEVNLEGYYKSNGSIEWVYDRFKRKPLVFMPAIIQGEDFFTMQMNVQLGENKGVMLHNDNYTNIPTAGGDFDIMFPYTGYISTGFDFSDRAGANFQLGMGSQSIGRSLSGSVIMSEYFTGASYANMEFYTTNFKYNMNVTQFNVDKYMYSHRLDARLFKKVQASIMESILVNAPMELRFLNPWTIYHGMSAREDYGVHDGRVCAYMTVTGTFVPTKFLRIYVLYAQDQYQTNWELTNWPDDVTPNARGGQVGVESYVPVKDGYFHAWLEGYYAEPFLYIKQSPDWSLMRTWQDNIGDMTIFYEWVGSPFGPDTAAGELSVGYEVPGKWSVTADYLFMARGEYSGTNIFKNLHDTWGGFDTDWDYDKIGMGNWPYPIESSDDGEQAEAKRRQALITPSGIPEYVHRISVRGTYMPQKWLSFTIQPAFVIKHNMNNTEGVNAFGWEVSFNSNFKLHNLYTGTWRLK